MVIETEVIPTVATLVPEAQAGGAMLKHFRQHCVLAEIAMFQWARGLSTDYSGGHWRLYELSNGGMYAVPQGHPEFKVEVNTNGYEGIMSADAFGIVTWLFMLCMVSETTMDDRVIDHYHALRDFACEHAERAKILRATD